MGFSVFLDNINLLEDKLNKLMDRKIINQSAMTGWFLLWILISYAYK